LQNANAYGATGFVENPLGLKLLQSAVADGGAWPTNRFQLFASATRKLAFERNAVRNVIARRGADEILDAASKAFLVLLLSGARAFWRSNNEPPSDGDARAYVTGDDLKIDRNLLDDMLDTPLFRGEGETFEPMHRTIAEFLAGKPWHRPFGGRRLGQRYRLVVRLRSSPEMTLHHLPSLEGCSRGLPPILPSTGTPVQRSD
jgi:hypothetical protein